MYFGPYKLNYKVTSGGENFISIKNVTVYNQSGKSIESLGGSFKIVSSYTGSSSKEITPTSGQTFYIVVERGSMSASQFTGFYAKFDFQYLESCSGTLQTYTGQTYNYYYEKTTGTTAKVMEGQYQTRRVRYKKNDEGKYVFSYYSYTWHDYSKEYRIDTVSYELKRVAAGDAQKLLGWSYDGSRNYKTYSLLITSNWEDTPNTPEIELEKVNSDGEGLYGAKFDVTLEISGKDAVYGYSVSQTMNFTRVTDSDGKATISYENIKAEGVSLGTFTGTIKVTFTETEAPAGYEVQSGSSSMTLTISKGAVTKVSGGTLSQDGTKYTATITIKDTKQTNTTPKIQIAKVDNNSNLISEADFKIYVSYTTGATFNSDGTVASYGTLQDDQTQIIRGTTTDGTLELTAKDFANMNNGFDITNYTGQITLDIVEVNVNGNYSIQSEGTDVTLTYIKGELVEYDATNGTITAETLTDYIIDLYYDYANGTSNEIKNYIDIDAWIAEQEAAYKAEVEANPDLTYEELTYDDILAYLTNYIEENKEDIFSLSTLSADYSNEVALITITDSAGDLPDMEFVGEPDTGDDLLMTIAGTVFLDQTTTKASENESDGYYTQGEELLYGVTVTLYNSDGSLATLVQKDGEIRTNPTVTDTNGFYSFNGVDPFGEYYVVFTYNGVEYTTTASSKETYNTDDETGNSAGWDDSSKASELTSARSTLNSSFSLISATTNAYDYYEIESIYSEIAARTIEYINTNGKYPDMNTIYNAVISNHSDDNEISNKIEYIKSSQINAYAGYYSKDGGISSATANGAYPYYHGQRFIINDESINAPSDTISFAGSTVPLIYPGQTQVNLGLVERDSTDLSLLTDIVDTVVSINGYDTEYSYYEGSSSYSQYIYEEDYNYQNANTSQTSNGVAYYTDDEIEFYMTYEIVVSNATLTSTALKEIVDYYDSDFSWDTSYTTSKGNTIAGITASVGGTTLTYGQDYTVTTSSSYGTSSEMTNNVNNTGYSSLYINFTSDKYITDKTDDVVIRIAFKMNEAKATLYNNIYTEDSSVSKMMEIGNYAEISAYKTQGGFLDSDSHPGNFSISEYVTARAEYQTAYSAYVANRTEEYKLALSEAMLNLTNVREDDAWYVQLTLANSGYTRTLTGNVWEAISDSVQTSSDLQNYEGLLEYTSDYGLEGIKVELVELCDDGSQVVRAQAVTDENGSYTFTSYIAGNYTVRFTYGTAYVEASGGSVDEEAGTAKSWYNVFPLDPVYSKNSTDSSGNYLQINGQYYQSTKANQNTNDQLYWYNESTSTRYSDAYDDAQSRESQINASIDGTNSTSSEYEYDGVMQVQSNSHVDTIYAYTSTLNLEIEYVKESVTGNQSNVSYSYGVENIDFGLTPRANTDLNIDKTVSNIKIYLQDGTLQLDAYAIPYDDGTVAWVYNNDESYSNTVYTTTSSVFPDGQINVELDEELLNGATLEVTYTVTVSNDGEYDTIKYIYNSDGKVIAIAYYNEEYTALPSYEGTRIERNSNGLMTEVTENKIVYHDDVYKKYSLEAVDGNKTTSEIGVATSATNIVDYIDPELSFSQVNKAGEEVNLDWELTSTDDFNSSREANEDIMSQYNTLIRATNESNLYTALLPGETASTKLTLSKVLSTSSSDTADYEYSNFIELTKIANTSGRITEIESYDITGYTDTSTITNISEISDNLYPTLGSSRSETISIHAPTGLSITEETSSNLGIVLITLVILAVGIVLIKKFVMTPKAQE